MYCVPNTVACMQLDQVVQVLAVKALDRTRRVHLFPSFVIITHKQDHKSQSKPSLLAQLNWYSHSTVYSKLVPTLAK